MKIITLFFLLATFIGHCQQEVTIQEQDCECADPKGTQATLTFTTRQDDLAKSWYLEQRLPGSGNTYRYQTCNTFPDSLTRAGLVISADVEIKRTCPHKKVAIQWLTLKSVQMLNK